MFLEHRQDVGCEANDGARVQLVAQKLAVLAGVLDQPVPKRCTLELPPRFLTIPAAVLADSRGQKLVAIFPATIYPRASRTLSQGAGCPGAIRTQIAAHCIPN